jgi:hypothetical protein
MTGLLPCPMLREGCRGGACEHRAAYASAWLCAECHRPPPAPLVEWPWRRTRTDGAPVCGAHAVEGGHGGEG